MADPEKKDADGPPLGGAGNGGAAGGAGSRDGGESERRLNTVLLAIIEREVGRGEPRRAEDWSALREMAARHPTGTDLVGTFESVIDRCNQELVQRFGTHGVDLTRLRESVVMLIRVSLAKKLGLGGAGSES